MWGWLTREHYFNDDAVRMFFTGQVEIGSIFKEGDPVSSRWDLAFELGTDAYTRQFDFGDAPETDYATTLSRNGAHHLLSSSIYLGESVDPDSSGQPDAAAMGDDNDGQDDEDGVDFVSNLIVGVNSEIGVKASTDGFLNGWIDFDQDGNWHELYDHAIKNHVLQAGMNNVEITVPENAELGETLARFRFSTESDLWFNGFAMNGEVEDYIVTIHENTAVKSDEFDVPLEWRLYSNYPNPFNPLTQISYSVLDKSHVNITVFNIQGIKVRTLQNGIQKAGHYSIKWDARDDAGQNLSSGIYLCKMMTAQYQETITMILLR
jgi:hypothetical protein